MAKQRIVIRVHYSVRTILEREAVWKGTTVGGLANSIIRRELEQVARQEAAGNAFVLRPQKPSGIGRIEKDPQKLRALYQAGYEEAKRRWPELERFLNE